MTVATCGRFHLGPQIGAGGMGRVYVAHDPQGGDVAVKISDRRALSEHTARSLESIHHRNVVRVLDHGKTDDGASYIVMDLVAGTGLGTLLRQSGGFALSRVLDIGMQLLDGLDAIHTARLVHGDIKSDNLMVDVAGGDLATIIDLGFGPIGTHHLFTGTPEYVAPEVIHGAPPHVGSDLYGVGIVLYEMVTATTPFAGGTPDEIFERHLVEMPAPMGAMCPGRAIPEELELLVARTLDKDPARRPASASELARELRHALPASHEDVAPPDATFSMSRPTKDWTRPTFSDTESAHVR